MKPVTTPYQFTGNIMYFSPAIDQPFNDVLEDFKYNATSNYVPIGVTILAFATLMEAIDWHLYKTESITMKDARKIIKDSAKLMDKKFSIKYKKLPR